VGKKADDVPFIRIQKMNDLAMSALFSACRDPVRFNAIKSSFSKSVKLILIKPGTTSMQFVNNMI
jgi:hypothetical protein